MTVAIRLAAPADAHAVSVLLNELGYRVPPAQVLASLAAMDVQRADPVFVATDKDNVAGLLALHIARWLQLEKPIARITALVVQGKYQRRGIGRRLLAHAESFAQSAGCGTLELTTAAERDEAQAFYREFGFEHTSIRFKKALT